MELGPEEVRVVGCLVEKQLTTPQQYPLTLNALVAACNQSSNRWPVTDYDERAVQSALDSLKAKGLVRFVHPAHGRSVTRYKHVLDEALELEPRQLALLTALMLRGPQTPGELRARTERMAAFADAQELEDDLDGLIRDHDLVARLPREPGRREARYTHLLGSGLDASATSGRTLDETEPEADADWEDEPDWATAPDRADDADPVQDLAPVADGDADRRVALPPRDVKDEIMALRKEVAKLGRAIDHILGRLGR